MNIIGNKMFTYIDNHSDLTVSMINQYNDSLIFLGDEKQIFVPLINAYVGIGKTAYEGLLAKIGESNSNLDEYNNYIHYDTVTSIYTQFSPAELEQYRQDSGGHALVRGINITEPAQTEVIFKANRNVVLKGLDDYNLPGGLDELGRVVTTQNTSGITLNVTHNSSIRTGIYSFNGIEYSYTYYDPYDTITIDDTKTWSYIMASNSYMVNFVTKFATQQADRVYKNLLGENTVYIEKEFDEAFNYDSVTETLNVFENVFVKLANGTFRIVDVQNYDDGFTISVDNTIIYSTSTTHPVDQNTDLTQILAGENNPGLYGGYINLSGTIVPVWYHRDNSETASSYYNIADGIQTLKEIAYILDTITDGNGSGYDTGIQLAYNIASNHDAIVDLQNWKQQIGTETVSSFKSESTNELLTVNYYSTDLWDKDRDSDGASIGKVKLDLDLRLAQTYILDGATYAAYIINHPGVTNTTYFIYKGDPTDVNNYLQLNSANGSATSGSGYSSKSEEIKALLKKKFPSYDDNTVIPYYEFITDGSKVTSREQRGIVTWGNMNNTSACDGYYIYFPYEEADYEFNKGLTDVKWVTTYVGWGVYELNNKIDTIDRDLTDAISAAINSLDKSDEDESNNGLFVTYVTETDGIINVNKKKLPLDTILKHDLFYTNDIYLHVTTTEAKTIQQNNPGHIYRLENGQYNQLTQQQVDNLSIDVDLYDYIYYKTTLYDMQSVPGSQSINPATVEDMILNEGNVTYFYKESANGYTKYLPLDIQTAYTEGTLFTNDVVTDDNTIYYLNTGSSISQIKYFDVSTIHRTNGSTTTLFTSYITYLAAASATNSGLADAWDVRRTIEHMFKWVDLKTNKIIG